MDGETPDCFSVGSLTRQRSAAPGHPWPPRHLDILSIAARLFK